jgi:hypothetical protein
LVFQVFGALSTTLQGGHGIAIQAFFHLGVAPAPSLPAGSHAHQRLSSATQADVLFAAKGRAGLLGRAMPATAGPSPPATAGKSAPTSLTHG